jgi:hypothetical protein
MGKDIIVTNKVKRHPDEKIMVEQKIIIDVKDHWVFIIHNGETLSMPVTAFLELQELTSQALKQYKSLK